MTLSSLPLRMQKMLDERRPSTYKWVAFQMFICKSVVWNSEFISLQKQLQMAVMFPQRLVHERLFSLNVSEIVYICHENV